MRFHFGFDRLETRLALSTTVVGLPSGVGASSILSGALNSPIISDSTASLTSQSSTRLVVSFGQAIDGFSVGVADFSIDHIAADGSETPLGPSEARLVETLDPTEPSGSRIAIQLTKPLEAGQYDLILSGQNSIQATDGTALGGGGSDISVGTFTIQTQSTSLTGATDLGLVSSTIGSQTDAINLAGDSGSVKLYKLTLAQGHTWRLGLSVTSETTGTPFDSTLSLFDAQGNLVSTRTGSEGTNPGDSYLFAGVGPGTYYVGVSSQGNIPGQSGGYSLVSGTEGTSGLSQPGGAFLLSEVADPISEATRVVGLSVDQADPNSSLATGLTVQFSGSIDVSSLTGSSPPVFVAVNGSGQSWPLTTAGYDESDAQLSLFFNQSLAPGQYSIQEVGGSLKDLAGLAPVAPGSPAGVLGSFTIQAGSNAPNDLGTLLPGVASTGLGSTVVVASGGSVVEHFEVVEAGVYSILGAGPSTGLQAILTDSTGKSWDLQSLASSHLILKAGSYSLTLSNPGPTETSTDLMVLATQSMDDSLLVGGSAQVPALSLRLIAPARTSDQGSGDQVVNRTESGINPQPSAISEFGASRSGSSSSIVSASDSASSVFSGSSTGVYFFASAGLVGRPSSVGEQISVVGPSGPTGSVALASNLQGIPSGLILSPSRRDQTPNPDSEPRTDSFAELESASIPRSSLLNIDFGLIMGDSTADLDDKVLEDASWLDQVVRSILQPIEPIAELVALAAPETTVLEPVVQKVAQIVQDATLEEETRVSMASMAPSVGFGIVVSLAYLYKGRILAQSGKPAHPSTINKASSRYRGPHKKIRVLS